MPVITSSGEDIAVIRLDNPPVNALSIAAGVVRDLDAAVRAALADDAITAIIIAGEGKFFSAGADINDFDGDPAALKLLRSTFNAIEDATKPIVMAIHGLALGGGLELAMAGHYRIATASCRFGLPEVTLGILPGAGGTQRLPRLAGMPDSIDMMLTGRPIGAEKALAIGLIDAIVADAVPGAIAFIKATPALSPRPTSRIPLPPGALDAVHQAQSGKRKRSLNRAPDGILQCVEAAATGSFADGLAIEAQLFSDLMASEASQGLRHAFFGQRQVAVIPGLPKAIKPQSIAKTAVVGAGLMGTGIALALLNAGFPVTLVEPRTEALDKAAASIAASFKRDVEKGRMTQDDAARRLAALECASDLAATANADLIIEAVFEELDVKRQVFAALDAAAKPSAIFASNTSTLPLDTIAGFTKRPGRVVGLHFFSPANNMRLVEIVRGAKTEPQVLATAMDFVKRLGKIGVVAGVCDGFIGNRIFEEYLRQVYQLLEEGALPQQIDAALETWGMAMGPLRTMDLAGQDIGWSIRKRRAAEQPNKPYSKLPDLVCELGRFGQKTGKGFYLYRDGRTAETDPEIDALVIRHSAGIGVTRRSIGDDEIVSRAVLAMVNEGARILAEGIAYRAIDIDMIYLNGYGFPAERGGPMFHADRLGLQNVLKTIEGYAQGANGWSWEPAPLLVTLANCGRQFRSTNT